MAKKALIMWGGWEGHTPKETGEILGNKLKEHGFEVRIENSLQPLEDEEAVKALDLVVPVWTMGEISKPQYKSLNKAVHDFGVGLGGVHGGMGDAFRGNVGYYWMVGGQFLGHPYIGEYTVRLTNVKSPITQGMDKTFTYKSEQYYMGMDPAVTVLADTVYQFQGKEVIMPVVWTRSWGKARVFYSALGHKAQEFTDYPHVLDMTIRGLVWAAEGKGLAAQG